MSLSAVEVRASPCGAARTSSAVGSPDRSLRGFVLRLVGLEAGSSACLSGPGSSSAARFARQACRRGQLRLGFGYADAFAQLGPFGSGGPPSLAQEPAAAGLQLGGLLRRLLPVGGSFWPAAGLYGGFGAGGSLAAPRLSRTGAARIPASCRCSCHILAIRALPSWPLTTASSTFAPPSAASIFTGVKSAARPRRLALHEHLNMPALARSQDGAATRRRPCRATRRRALDDHRAVELAHARGRRALAAPRRETHAGR